MKEKLLSGIVAMSTVLTVATSTVNAAKLELSADKVAAGETVDVTVSLDNEANSLDYELAYDSEMFEFVDSKCDLSLVEVNSDTPGTVIVSGVDTDKGTKYMTVTLKALKDGDAEFEVKNLEAADEETPLAVTKAAVEVQTAAATPTPSATPEETAAPETTPTEVAATPTSSAEETESTNKSSNTNKSGKNNPNTGDGIVAYIAAFGAAVVAMVAIAVKKFTK